MQSAKVQSLQCDWTSQTSDWYKQFHHLLFYMGLSYEFVLPGVLIGELLKLTFNEDLIGVNLLKSW